MQIIFSHKSKSIFSLKCKSNWVDFFTYKSKTTFISSKKSKSTLILRARARARATLWACKSKSKNMCIAHLNQNQVLKLLFHLPVHFNTGHLLLARRGTFMVGILNDILFFSLSFWQPFLIYQINILPLIHTISCPEVNTNCEWAKTTTSTYTNVQWAAATTTTTATSFLEYWQAMNYL